MDNLSGCIVNERNKKPLIRIGVRIKSILKFDDICEDDVQSMIEDLATIQLQEKDRKEDVTFIPAEKDRKEDRSKILAILEEKKKEEATVRMISFRFQVTDKSLGTKLGEIKVDAEDRADADRKAGAAARKKFKGKKVDLKSK